MCVFLALNECGIIYVAEWKLSIKRQSVDRNHELLWSVTRNCLPANEWKPRLIGSVSKCRQVTILRICHGFPLLIYGMTVFHIRPNVVRRQKIRRSLQRHLCISLAICSISENTKAAYQHNYESRVWQLLQ